jgi:hypothetical protein
MNSYNSVTKTPNNLIIRKLKKDLNGHFSKNDLQMAKAHEKMFNH